MTANGKGCPVHEIVKWYDSPEDFHAYCSQPNVSKAHESGHHSHPTTDWGGVNYKGALKNLIYGDAERARLAIKLFDEVVTAQTETLGRNILIPATVGQIPNVPAVIAGLPETMLSRQNSLQTASNAPIRVVVDLFASWPITQQQFIRRGVAAIAFVMVMNTIRPIDLYVAHTGGSMFLPGSSVAHIIKIDTKPLDLPRAVWMISDPAFFRRLGFCSIMNEVRPFQDSFNKTKDYLEDCIPAAKEGREWLKLSQDDVYIDRMYYGDILAVNDPMKWVNMMIKEHTLNVEVMKQAQEVSY